eukprot:12055437-Karenia_brevis.AAC.1
MASLTAVLPIPLPVDLSYYLEPSEQKTFLLHLSSRRLSRKCANKTRSSTSRQWLSSRLGW